MSTDIKLRFELQNEKKYTIKFSDYMKFSLIYKKLPEDCKDGKEFESKCGDKFEFHKYQLKDTQEKKHWWNK